MRERFFSASLDAHLSLALTFSAAAHARISCQMTVDMKKANSGSCARATFAFLICVALALCCLASNDLHSWVYFFICVALLRYIGKMRPAWTVSQHGPIFSF